MCVACVDMGVYWVYVGIGSLVLSSLACTANNRSIDRLIPLTTTTSTHPSKTTKPPTHPHTQWFGLGLTLVDSLDLLHLLGEHEEFAGAAQWVAKELDPSVDVHVNVFEVTIRVLGGLLAAYHLSGEEAFLTKVSRVVLLPARG